MSYRSLRLDGEPPEPRHHRPDFLALAERTATPRRSGTTHALDRGLSPLALGSLLITVDDREPGQPWRPPRS